MIPKIKEVDAIGVLAKLENMATLDPKMDSKFLTQVAKIPGWDLILKAIAKRGGRNGIAAALLTLQIVNEISEGDANGSSPENN